MSNAIHYDTLLVRYLAAELSDRLKGRRLEALTWDRSARAAALVTDGEALIWSLHPMAGAVFFGAPPGWESAAALPRRARIERVAAPADERLVLIDLGSPALRPDRAARIAVELLGNQWNLVAVSPEGRVLDALHRRATGARRLVPGVAYTPPPPTGRAGRDAPIDRDAWRLVVGGAPPAERERALVRAVAYTSPINAGPILGAAAESGSNEALDAAYRRYVALAALPPAAPRIVSTARGPQPYPLPLPGLADRPASTLLAAIAGAAEIEAPPPAVPGVAPALLARLRRRIERLNRRRERLAVQQAGAAPEAAALRRRADLLLSQMHLVRKGMTEVEIADFQGGTIRLELDPALSPNENARRLYDRARKRERAADRIPRLIAQADAERARLAALLERAEAGAADAEEVAAEAGTAEKRPAGPDSAGAPTLPYRRYRTSGGLEVRVGRSRRANDDLTFRHSSPDDVWLHARDAAGAHVILRWTDASSNPPARDLTEAAVLAARGSRARTSGTVAVDWTRRKYVRKPRKAPPGLVTIDRARTLFVEPDPALERRLRIDD